MTRVNLMVYDGSGQITIIHQPEIRPFWGDSPH